MNKVIIIGHLGMEPEIKYTKGGVMVGRLSIATIRKWRDKQNVLREETEWHRVTVWAALADFAMTYCPKGRQVMVEGRLKTDKYEKNGVTHYSTGIVGETLQGLGPSPSPRNKPAGSPKPAGQPGNDEWAPPEGYQPDDDIAF